MKKFVKLLLLFLFLLPLSTLSVAAAETEDETKNAPQELYENFYEESGLDTLQEAVPQEVQEALSNLDIDLSSSNGLLNFDVKKIWQLLIHTFTTGITVPLQSAAAIVGILLLAAAVDGFFELSAGESPIVLISFVVIVLKLQPLFTVTAGCAQAIRAAAVFGAAVVPVMAVILVSLGRTLTASSASALLLFVCEAVSQAVSFVFVPLMGGCMCLGICSAISPISGFERLSAGVKSVSIKGMAAMLMVFETVLSLQTVITAKGESLGIKATQMLIGGSLPVLGGAVSSTLSTAAGCVSVLGSSAAIYAVVVLILILLPMAAQILCWRGCLWLCSAAAQILNQKKLPALFTALDYCLAILLGALLLVGLLLILSITVVIKAGAGI